MVLCGVTLYVCRSVPLRCGKASDDLLIRRFTTSVTFTAVELAVLQAVGNL
jgi:hypothetical protein